MKQQFSLELADIKTIAAAAEAEALKNNWAVSICIVDDGGHLLSFQRLDGAAPVSAHIAPGKARELDRTQGWMVKESRAAMNELRTLLGNQLDLTLEIQ